MDLDKDASHLEAISQLNDELLSTRRELADRTAELEFERRTREQAEGEIRRLNAKLGQRGQVDTTRLKVAQGGGIAERQRAEAALQEKQVRLELLYHLSSGILAGLSVDQIIARTVDYIADAFPDLRVGYFTIDAQDVLTLHSAIEPPSMSHLDELALDLNSAPDYLQALRNGITLAVPDVTTDPRYAMLQTALVARGVRACLDVPLTHSEELVGL